jgi:hypothetical protein
VGTTLGGLRSALIERCGVPETAITVVSDPETLTDLGAAVSDLAARAVYYVGHGLVSTTGALYLATKSSRQHAWTIEHTALAYDTVRRYLLASRARSVVVVLDCCFAGRAVAGLNAATYLADLTEVTGAFVLTVAGREEVALAPPGSPHTAFSGALLTLLRDGDEHGPPELTLHDVHR